jgi:hypothetical protein
MHVPSGSVEAKSSPEHLLQKILAEGPTRESLRLALFWPVK